MNSSQLTRSALTLLLESLASERESLTDEEEQMIEEKLRSLGYL